MQSRNNHGGLQINDGDKVWVEGTVIDTWTTGVKVELSGADDRLIPHTKPIYRFSNYEIKKHIPVTKPIEVGCRVFYTSEAGRTWENSLATHGKVKAIIDDKAWVLWNNKEESVDFLERLTRII